MVLSISLLGGFSLSSDGPDAAVSPNSRRLLALLALRAKAVGRSTAAGTMWPESTRNKANYSLRATLTRMDDRSRALIHIDQSSLRLVDAVEVDLRSSHALALRLLPPGVVPQLSDLSPESVAALSEELLPDWYDDWVLAAAEDWRGLRMNGLEAQTRLLVARDRLPEASIAARAAIAVEPLRESAQAALIRVHMAEGNQSEALRVFDRYSVLLWGSLQLEPTPLLSFLVRDITR